MAKSAAQLLYGPVLVSNSKVTNPGYDGLLYLCGLARLQQLHRVLCLAVDVLGPARVVAYGTMLHSAKGAGRDFSPKYFPVLGRTSSTESGPSPNIR